jgi:superfamily II DNA or RNA helicase
VTQLLPGMRVRPPGFTSFLLIDDVVERGNEVRVYLVNDAGDTVRYSIAAGEVSNVEILEEDGYGASSQVLAGLWSEWMQQAIHTSKATALSSTPLQPYLHQDEAVYGAMLPQPMLRFLIADEPGTGKTIMAGLYLREMKRLGLVRRALIVAPAHLVSKWQADFRHFFGGAPERITSEIVSQGPLRPDRDTWIVSLDLASVNPIVQEEIRPDRAGWDLVIFDEAHRLTPTAQGYYRVGRMLSRGAPRALLMTATPHRGKEWLFRALLHLVDPEVFPEVDRHEELSTYKPSSLHFLRRIKEELVNRDGVTPLFKGREAFNIKVTLGPIEDEFYRKALDLVDRYFPPNAAPLGRMVYGKRAASSLHALTCTLERRRDRMGTALPSEVSDSGEFDDEAEVEERRVLVEASRSAREEKREIAELLERMRLATDGRVVSTKWKPLIDDCLASNGIRPGTGEQAVIFTEFADTATWLVKQLRDLGFTAERYSGADAHSKRDEIRERFMRREFEIFVSTDAGNEGIDLQSAHVLANFDCPWSLVRLEQRMGRIHRVGQDRDVKLYNLIATDTEEGEVLAVLLDNLVAAANQLGGKLFDSLSLVVELVGEELDVNLDPSKLVPRVFHGEKSEALAAAKAMTSARLQAATQRARAIDDSMATRLDIAAASQRLNAEALERVNPKIVEAYLTRILLPTGEWLASPSVLGGGDGVYILRRRGAGRLPAALGAGDEVTVATSGAALERVVEAGGSTTNVIPLGPAEPALRELVDAVRASAEPSLLRGGALYDPTSITNYDLFVFVVEFQEGSGPRTSEQRILVRCDTSGARVIRWEKLADLTAADQRAGGLHPAHAADANELALRHSHELAAERIQELSRWRETAERSLDRLPTDMTREIDDPDRRRTERKRLSNMAASRLAELRRLAEFTVRNVRRAGWARVLAGGVPPEPTEQDSEIIAMKTVAEHLRDAGWRIADVHTEDRGYDLHATRGSQQRCVEVKGVWENASSTGVSLTGNEVLIASQLASDYWLYVVDQCHAGGRIYSTYCDPANVFNDTMRALGTVHINGSVLAEKRKEDQA